MVITNSDIGVIINSILFKRLKRYWKNASPPQRTKSAALSDFLKIINYVERLRALFFIAQKCRKIRGCAVLITFCIQSVYKLLQFCNKL